MPRTRPRTDYYIYVCTNPECSEGLVHWKSFGKRTSHKCFKCGKFLNRIRGEFRGTPHSR